MFKIVDSNKAASILAALKSKLDKEDGATIDIEVYTKFNDNVYALCSSLSGTITLGVYLKGKKSGYHALVSAQKYEKDFFEQALEKYLESISKIKDSVEDYVYNARVDRDTCIDYLKKALAEEFIAYYQYTFAAPFVSFSEGEEVEHLFNQQAYDELYDHAMLLLKRIRQLGGDTQDVFCPVSLMQKTENGINPFMGFDGNVLLIQNIISETKAIETYKHGIELFSQDDVTVSMFTDILSDEQKHLDELVTLYNRKNNLSESLEEIVASLNHYHPIQDGKVDDAVEEFSQLWDTGSQTYKGKKIEFKNNGDIEVDGKVIGNTKKLGSVSEVDLCISEYFNI